MAAFNKHKPMSEETSKQLKKNGTLSDYLKDLKEHPPERFNEEDLHLDFYNLLK